jgi:hypothetical protein
MHSRLARTSAATGRSTSCPAGRRSASRPATVRRHGHARSWVRCCPVEVAERASRRLCSGAQRGSGCLRTVGLNWGGQREYARPLMPMATIATSAICKNRGQRLRARWRALNPWRVAPFSIPPSPGRRREARKNKYERDAGAVANRPHAPPGRGHDGRQLDLRTAEFIM